MSSLCSKDCPFAGGEATVSGSACDVVLKAQQVLQDYFKLKDFRPGQLSALLPPLHGRDVFIRLATGAGKSLCMFLPPLIASPHALGVVISPLHGLMDQQVQQLHDVGVNAVRICGKDKALFDDVTVGKFRFVFMSPEVAVKPPWREIFKTPMFQKNLALVAIDEAHCIPEWGSDFRKSFSKLGGLRALTSAPFMALTASAPAGIQAAIVESLHLVDPVLVLHQLDRPNIFLSVGKSVGLSRDLGNLASLLGSEDLGIIPKTVVFCNTKDAAHKVYTFLRKSAHYKHSVGMYHASLTSETRSFACSNFAQRSTEARCICATIAFGMGMDISDIELVIVYGLPDSMVQLYQLLGRAGRNGSSARGHLFFNPKSLQRTKDQSLQIYCSDKENCKRSILLASVGNARTCSTATQCCDTCTQGKVPYSRVDILSPTQLKRSKRPIAVRDVTSDLRDKIKSDLFKEREKVLEEYPSYRMLGSSFICSDSIISELCSKAKFVKSVDDLNNVCGLRPELSLRFFSVMWETISSAPPPQKKRRK